MVTVTGWGVVPNHPVGGGHVPSIFDLRKNMQQELGWDPPFFLKGPRFFRT